MKRLVFSKVASCMQPNSFKRPSSKDTGKPLSLLAWCRSHYFSKDRKITLGGLPALMHSPFREILLTPPVQDPNCPVYCRQEHSMSSTQLTGTLAEQTACPCCPLCSNACQFWKGNQQRTATSVESLRLWPCCDQSRELKFPLPP